MIFFKRIFSCKKIFTRLFSNYRELKKSPLPKNEDPSRPQIFLDFVFSLRTNNFFLAKEMREMIEEKLTTYLSRLLLL